jgi:tetratricopeptide (TPR) repeat protein
VHGRDGFPFTVPAGSLLRAVLLAGVLVLLAAPAAAQQAGDSSFSAATEAFGAGDYARALALFERARASGVTGAALDYNVAVCRYKLGDYRGAEAAFAALAEIDPAFRDLARYNLGLSLLAQGRGAEADRWFESVRASADPTLAALASRAASALDGEPAPRAAWTGSVDFAVGYDDNVALVDDASLPTAESSESAFSEVFGFASRPFATAVPTRLDVTGYVVEYPEADGFDQAVLRLDYAVRLVRESWWVDVGPHLSRATLGGTGFEQQLGANVRAVYELNDRAALDFRVVYAEVSDVSPQFSFIDGSRESVRALFDTRGARARLRFSYDFERNDRAAASVSSERSRFAVRVTRALNAQWELDATASYRKASHDRLELPADERLKEWSLVANRTLFAAWSIEAGYYGADNESDFAAFAYDRNRMSIGVTRLF